MISDIAAYAIAASITRFLIILLSPIVAILVSDIGLARWSVAISLSSLFAAIMGMGMSSALLRWHADSNFLVSFDLIGWFLRLRLISFVFALTFLCGASLIAWGPLSGGTLSILSYLPALLLFGAAEAIARFFTSVMRLQDRPRMLVLIRIGHAGMAALATVAASVLAILEPFIAFAISYAVGALPMLLSIARLGTKPNRDCSPDTKDVIRFALPLTLHDLGWWLRGTALTLVVANFADEATVGAFFLAMLVIMPFAVLLTGIDQALELDYLRRRASGGTMDTSSRSYRCAVLSMTALIVCCMASIGPVSHALMPKEAEVIAVVAPIALFGIACHAAYVVWVKPLIYRKRSGLLFCGTASISISGVTFAIFMTPLYGFVAAALASAFMFAATAVFVLTASLAIGDKPLDFIGPVFAVSVSGATLVTLLLL